MIVPLNHILLLSALLFVMGMFCTVSRRNLIMMLLGLEILLNAASIAFVGASLRWQHMDGQALALFIMAVAAADRGPGRYRLGSDEIIVSGDLRCAKPGQPNLAGSALTLDRAVLNVARYCDVPFPEAWAMASTRPALSVTSIPLDLNFFPYSLSSS